MMMTRIDRKRRRKRPAATAPSGPPRVAPAIPALAAALLTPSAAASPILHTGRALGRLALLTRAIPPAVLPIIFSLVVHAVLLIVLISITWTSIGGGHGGYARAEVVISLPAASPPSAQAVPSAGAGEVFAPAPVQSAVPRLQGLSTPALSALPTLRSAGAGLGTPADLLRSQDDSFIGGATFAGLGTRQASSVVYVVDASGAMITSLQFVLAELERSVRNLSSAQKFQVVLFRDRPGNSPYDLFVPPGIRSDRAGLIAATPANKVALAEWLKTIRPTGRSNPIEGLRRGISFDPDAIFLLSRSIRRSGGELASDPPGGVWGRPTEQTLAELDRLNPRSRLSGKRRVIIKAIQFLEEDPSGTMQAIGNEHGDGPGSYSVLTLQSLRERGTQ
jgi:hypothetical protein